MSETEIRRTFRDVCSDASFAADLPANTLSVFDHKANEAAAHTFVAICDGTCNASRTACAAAFYLGHGVFDRGQQVGHEVVGHIEAQKVASGIVFWVAGISLGLLLFRR
jgi:hypothetical protein